MGVRGRSSRCAVLKIVSRSAMANLKFLGQLYAGCHHKDTETQRSGRSTKMNTRYQAARPLCLCVFVVTNARVHLRFFSVLGTTLSASFVSAAVCLALPTASCKANRSASFFGLNFS